MTLYQIILKAIRLIFDGDDSVVPKAFFDITNNKLQYAITKVFGLEYKHNDILVTQLRTNAAVFAAFKAHKQGNVLRDLLVDENGKPRLYKDYMPLAEKVALKWNRHWMQTEYNTAIARARTAEQFYRYQQDADLYPNIRWVPSRSIDPRLEHKPLYGIIKPINDTFWTTHYPGNLWNCKCDIEQTRQRPTRERLKRNIPKPEKGVDENPRNGELFTQTHPVFRKVTKAIKKEVEMYGKRAISISEQKLSKAWAKKNIDMHKGLIIKSENLQTGHINYRRGSVKEILAHNTDPIIKAYPRHLPDDVKNWEYMGWGNVTEGKHQDTIAFAYYKRQIDGKMRYINVKLCKSEGETPYAIMDHFDEKALREGDIPKELLDKVKAKK